MSRLQLVLVARHTLQRWRHQMAQLLALSRQVPITIYITSTLMLWQYFEPLATTTTTSYIASKAQATKATINAQGSAQGTVIDYQPSVSMTPKNLKILRLTPFPQAGYQYTTTTYGGYSSTTTLAEPSDSVSGTVEVRNQHNHQSLTGKRY